MNRTTQTTPFATLGRLLGFLMTFVITSDAFAQAGVQIKIDVTGYGASPTGFQIEGTFLPSTPTGTDGYKIASISPATNDWTETLSFGPVRVEVGKSYTVYQGTPDYAEVVIVAPQGYRVVIDGIARTTAPVDPTFVFVIEPLLQHPGLAGHSSSVSNAGIKWSLPLGTLHNGQSAGEIVFSNLGLGSSWAGLLTPGSLSYESSSDEVYVHRVSGQLGAVVANQVCVGIGSSSGVLGLTCIMPTSVTIYGNGNWPVVTGPTLYAYTIALGSTNTTLVFTRRSYDVTSPASPGPSNPAVYKEETMTLARTGTWPAFTWTKTDWTEVGKTAVRQVVTVGSSATGGRTEAITVKVPGGATALSLTRDYTDTAAGQLQTGESAGTSNAMGATFDYYTNISYPWYYGYLKSATLPGGGWVSYQYGYTGRVEYQFKPYLDSPSSVTQNTSQGEVTYYEYTQDAYGVIIKPSLIQTSVNGVVKAKTTLSYTFGSTIEITKTDYTSSGATLVTVTKTNGVGTSFYSEMPYSVRMPDGSKVVSGYRRGTWSGSAFTGSTTGKATQKVVMTGTHVSSSETDSTPSGVPGGTGTVGTNDTIYLVPGKSRMDLTIRDSNARVVRTESHRYSTSSSWQLVGSVDYTYNAIGQLTATTSSNGAVSGATYAYERKASDTDETGVKTTYAYDAGGRLLSELRTGQGEITPITTAYTYNAMDQVLTKRRIGWAQTEEIVLTNAYDDAGRITSETPPGLGATTHSYNVSSRTHTITRPDGSTVIETKYRNGQLASQTGTGIVPQYFTFGLETDGRAWSQVDVGTSSSSRWQKSWTDWLGRPIKSEKPGFTGQSNIVEENLYETTTGRLYKKTKTGYAPTRLSYNVLGQVNRSGLDVNDNGLVLSSDDRIVETNEYLESYNSAWWLRSDETKYTVSNSGTGTVTGTKRQRLTGFSGNRISETQTIDVEGNVTVETLDVDRALRTSVKTTSRTGVTNTQVQTTLNGHPTKTLDFDGLLTSQTYDALLRPYKTTDSRSNTSTTTYYTGTELKEIVKDGTNQTVATFGYDTSGRVAWQADALSNLTRTSFTARGQVYRQWGGGTYPVEYGYDSTYGDRTTQSTFRGGTGWDGSTWPGSPGTADTTTWAYDGPSGLMTSKTDALSRASLYTYNVRGQLNTREWARLVTTGASTGQRVKTTYGYSSTTGEQTTIDYNDATTTGLVYAYNRVGQAEYITDATGTRLLEYCTPCGVVLSETLDATYYGNRKITYKRDQSTTGRLGQGIGYKLGTASSPASDQEVTYGYENLSRFNTLMTGFANNSSSRVFRYGYEPDSALLKTLTVDGSPFIVNRTYEDDRDFLTSIETKGNSPLETYAKYTYTYDVRGFRSTALQSGTAFADYGDSTYYRYTYDGRGELTAALEYMGTNVTQTTNYLPGRQFEYAYDTIGNRQWSNRTTVTGLRDDYTTNALNQYTARENNTVSISGTATSDSLVAVNGRNVTAGRRGNFWSDEVTVANVLTPWRGPLSVYAAKPSGGNHLLRYDSRTAQIPAITESPTYDLDGNPLSDGFWDYKWDAENRLIRLETNSTARSNGVPYKILEFQYDYLSRRVQKKAIDGNLSQEFSCRRYLYNGWDVIAEYTAAGGSSFGALVRTYTWGLDIARSLSDAGGVGALVQIADHATGKAFLPAYDGNGNVAALVNAASGALAAAYEYSPYGEQLRADVLDTTIADQPFRFSTKWTDDESGLVYYGRRYYDPRNGRFVGRDPIEEEGGLNLYAFCSNNSINRWDLLGNNSYFQQLTDQINVYEEIGIANLSDDQRADYNNLQNERGQIDAIDIAPNQYYTGSWATNMQADAYQPTISLDEANFAYGNELIGGENIQIDINTGELIDIVANRHSTQTEMITVGPAETLSYFSDDVPYSSGYTAPSIRPSFAPSSQNGYVNPAMAAAAARARDFAGSFALMEGASEILAEVAVAAISGGVSAGLRRVAAGRVTAAGTNVTAHGLERLAGAAATRGGVLSASEIELVKNGAAQVGWVVNGTKNNTLVRIIETAPGKFNGYVEGTNGIMTTFKNFGQKALDKMAKGYGWDGWP